MAQPLRLEVFETPETLDGPVFLMPEQVEDIRLNAYERGYVAGWDDNGQQSDTEISTQRAAMLRQVEQLSFSYYEARAHVLRAIEPLFKAIFDTVLPVAVRASVVPVTIEQLLPFAVAAAEAPIILRVSTGMRAEFETAFEGLVLPPITLVETDELAQGQTEFVFDATESRIDLSHTAEMLKRAIDRFYQIQSEESQSA